MVIIYDRMKKGLIVLIIGVVLACVGGGISVLGLEGFTSPAEISVWDHEFPDSGGSEIANLDSGSYEIWCIEEMDAPVVEIKRMNGDVLHNTFSNSGSETVSPGDTSYEKLGGFEITTDDNYIVEATGGTIYITPQTNYFAAIGQMCGGVVLLIFGLILIFGGIFMVIRDKKGPPTVAPSTRPTPPPITAPPPSPYEPPPPSPYEPPPPPPPY